MCFVQFYFLTENGRFCKGYSPWMEAVLVNIQNGIIFRIFDLFLSGFLHTITVM